MVSDNSRWSLTWFGDNDDNNGIACAHSIFVS